MNINYFGICLWMGLQKLLVLLMSDDEKNITFVKVSEKYVHCHFNIEIILQPQHPCLVFHRVTFYQMKALIKYEFNTL